MPSRFCICRGCPACKVTEGTHGVLFERDSTASQRCPDCRSHAIAARNRRPSSSSRGLGWAFSRRKQSSDPDAVAYRQATHCQCNGCPQHTGLCGEKFGPDNPKTAGHSIARSRGGGSSPILAVCRRCNSSDGGRLASRG